MSLLDHTVAVQGITYIQAARYLAEQYLSFYLILLLSCYNILLQLNSSVHHNNNGSIVFWAAIWSTLEMQM